MTNRRLKRQITRLSKRRQRGVTLVEVLIVVAIMALVAGGVGALVIPHMEKSRIKNTRRQAQALRGAVTTHVALQGRSCPTVGQLVEAKELEPANQVDAWGTEFNVYCDQQDISVSSAGPDGQHETEDDIWVPEELEVASVE